jgi:hypothetical protein
VTGDQCCITSIDVSPCLWLWLWEGGLTRRPDDEVGGIGLGRGRNFAALAGGASDVGGGRGDVPSGLCCGQRGALGAPEPHDLQSSILIHFRR